MNRACQINNRHTWADCASYFLVIALCIFELLHLSVVHGLSCNIVTCLIFICLFASIVYVSINCQSLQCGRPKKKDIKQPDQCIANNDVQPWYSILVSKIPVGVYILRVNTFHGPILEYVSPVFAKLFDTPTELTTNNIVVSSIHPDDLPDFVESNTNAIKSDSAYKWEGRIVVNNIVKWVRFESTPVSVTDNDVIWYGTVVDITAQKVIELNLLESLTRLQDAQAYAHIAWWELDRDQVTGQWSPEMSQITGLPDVGVFLPTSLRSIIHPSDIKKTVDSLELCFSAGREHSVEYRIIRPDTRAVRWIDCHARPVVNELGEVIKVKGFIQDITERKLLEEQIVTMANYDQVTGLPNRRKLLERLTDALTRARRTTHYGAFMFIDLDNFKEVNDTYGHRAGDQLLIEVSARMTECVRETDTVARMGGDEFVVVLGDLDKDRDAAMKQAIRLAEDIKAMINRPYVLQDAATAHICTASIGITMFTHNAASESDVIGQADSAMYKAKESGRNQIKMYSPPSRSNVPDPNDPSQYFA